MTRPSRPIPLLCVLTVLALWQPAVAFGQAPGSSRPRVRLVATGGTISNRTGGRLTAEELVKSIPELDQHVRAEFEQFANESSSSLTIEQWIQLARRINELYRQDSELAGIVVTSGTDTLEELAYFGLRVAAEDLAPLKARVLLMLALTKTRDPAEIQRMFSEY